MLHMIFRFMEMLDHYQRLVLPFAILISLALCFLGYKYRQVWVAAFGFFAGLGGGYLVASKFVDSSTYAPILIGLLAGIILTLVSIMFFKAGLFVFCAAVAGSFVWSLPLMCTLREKVRYMDLPGTMGPQLATILPVFLTIVVAVAVGLGTMKKTRPVVILTTGIAGAFRAIMSGIVFFHICITPDSRFAWLGVIGLLTVLGIVVQFFTTD